LSKRTRNHLIALLMAGLLAASSALWWNRPTPNVADAAAALTVEATHRDFSSSVKAIGTVKPKIGAEVRMGSRLSGRLERLPANIGDKVEEGQVLAELESADLRAIVARFIAAAAVARGKIADAEARVRLSEAVYQRHQRLIRTNAISQQVVDEAAREHQSALVGVEIAKMELELVQAQLREAEVTLSYATIKAPISGIVASVTTQQGETVAAGLTAPTFLTIVDLDRLQVNALVDEVDIGKVRIGQRVVFNVDAFPAQDFSGQVTAIYPSATIVDNVVKYVTAVDINETKLGLLRPEMTANVQIMLETRTVLAIPTRAIRQENGRSIVYVAKGIDSEVRPIRVGWRDGSWAEVVEGIAAGERILLNASATSGGKPR
jgi:RND family efflux transporter MFP subunit